MMAASNNITPDKQQQKSIEEMIDDQIRNEIRLVLIGKSGHGKSSFGNTICDREVFPVRVSGSSYTKECGRALRMFEGKELLVVDTPGFFDTRTKLDTIRVHLHQAIASTRQGPDAFLIVIEANRFTEEEQRTVELINDIFGQDVSKFCIVIITREEDILYHKQTVEDYIESSELVKKLVTSCHNRYLAVNNHASREEREAKVRQLIGIVQTMSKDNQKSYYTKKQLEKADEDRRKRKQEASDKEFAERIALEQSIQDKIIREMSASQPAVEAPIRSDNKEQTGTTKLETVLKFMGKVLTPITKGVPSIACALINSNQSAAHDNRSRSPHMESPRSLTEDTSSIDISALRIPPLRKFRLSDCPDFLREP